MSTGLSNRQCLSLWVDVYWSVVIWYRENVCLRERRSKVMFQAYTGKMQGGGELMTMFCNLLTPSN